MMGLVWNVLIISLIYSAGLTWTLRAQPATPMRTRFHSPQIQLMSPQWNSILIYSHNTLKLKFRHTLSGFSTFSIVWSLSSFSFVIIQEYPLSDRAAHQYNPDLGSRLRILTSAWRFWMMLVFTWFPNLSSPSNNKIVRGWLIMEAVSRKTQISHVVAGFKDAQHNPVMSISYLTVIAQLLLCGELHHWSRYLLWAIHLIWGRECNGILFLVRQ